MKLPPTLEEAVVQMARLPGIGEKTALRQVLAMLNWDHQQISQFSSAMEELNNLGKCQECGIFSDQEFCSVCADQNRSAVRTICLVENIKDCLAIEKSGHFKGVYHVLGGVLNPLMGIGPDQLHLEKLFERIHRLEIEEVILAINPSIEGDATCSYLRDKISIKVKVERIGFGIPIGGSLEYLDLRTISKALENRRPFN